jgi:hypothetical protein
MICLKIIMDCKYKMSIRKYLELMLSCNSINKPKDLGIEFYNDSVEESHEVSYKILDKKVWALARIKYGL